MFLFSIFAKKQYSVKKNDHTDVINYILFLQQFWLRICSAKSQALAITRFVMLSIDWFTDTRQTPFSVSWKRVPSSCFCSTLYWYSKSLWNFGSCKNTPSSVIYARHVWIAPYNYGCCVKSLNNVRYLILYDVPVTGKW